MFGRRAARDENDKPFWKQRSWLIAATFIATALVLALVSAIGSGSVESDTADSGPLSARTSGSERPSGCRTDDSATTLALPADLKWRLIGPAKVPTSPSAGPTLTDRSMLWCFAHTRLGAVLAAHVITAQMSNPGWRHVAEQQVVPGFGRNMFISFRSSVTSADAEGRSSATYMGFSLVHYQPDEAEVEMLLKDTQGSLSATSVSVRWSGGDWKVEANSDGSLHSSLTPVNNTVGFELWRH